MSFLSRSSSFPPVACLLFALLVAPVDAATTKASLHLDHDAIRPGETVTAGVRLQMEEHWHTYWKNPGDSGDATKIEWTLPEGVTAGEIQWPVPMKIESLGFYTYGYEDEVVLLVPLTVAADAEPGVAAIKADVSWLECYELCLPADATLTTELRIDDTDTPSSDAALFADWRERMPMVNDAVEAGGAWLSAEGDDERVLRIEATVPDGSPRPVDFLPDLLDKVDVGSASEIGQQGDGLVSLTKEVILFEGGEWPETITGLVTTEDPAVAYQVSFSVVNLIPELAAAADGGSVSDAGGGALVNESAPPVNVAFGFWTQLAFAFLGGLILNIMPCVLPVIALKVLGFVQQSREEPAVVRRHGLLYGAGVLVSFLVLAALVVGFKLAGQAVGWGFQFQSTEFIVLMTIVILLVALNLFGVFEITLGGRTMGAAGMLASRPGASGSFFNGVLATVLGTPCVAPFLAPALGFAFAQSTGVIVLFFLMVGVGLASPYVLLSFFPRLGRFMPKPGAWMVRFKQAMGFPMLATAIWLFSLTDDRFGPNGTFWFGLSLLFIAIAAWVYGEFVQRGRTGVFAGRVVALLLLVLAVGYGLERQMNWRNATMAVDRQNDATTIGGITWEPWSLAAIDEARAAGRPVVVNFTADWCVTCQTAVKPALQSEPVEKRLTELGAVTLVAEYNRPLEQEDITEEIQRHGRAGIPLVLVYPADQSLHPQIIPDSMFPHVYRRNILLALDSVSTTPPRTAALK